MPEIAILIIGSEIISAEIRDINAYFLAKKLNEMGLVVNQIRIVSDSREKIERALSELSETSKAIICSGGLGPTSDDFTREVIADFAGLELVEDAGSKAKMEKYYKSRGREINQNSLRQVVFPKNSNVITNPHGTADAFVVKLKNACHIYALPGVPSELNKIFEEKIALDLERLFGKKKKEEEKYFRIFGISESQLGNRIDSLGLPKEISVSYLPQFPELFLKLASFNRDALTRAEKKVEVDLGNLVFSRQRSETLSEVVLALLLERKEKVAFAESCSGGLLADSLVSLSGSSEAFFGSLVTYANLAKEMFLEIPKELLETKGAVSKEVAELMARNLRLKTGVDHAISITGIAGPNGDTSTKKVGDVFIGIANNQETKSFFYQMPLERNRFRALVVATALNLLRLEIQG